MHSHQVVKSAVVFFYFFGLKACSLDFSWWFHFHMLDFFISAYMYCLTPLVYQDNTPRPPPPHTHTMSFAISPSLGTCTLCLSFLYKHKIANLVKTRILEKRVV